MIFLNENSTHVVPILHWTQIKKKGQYKAIKSIHTAVQTLLQAWPGWKHWF